MADVEAITALYDQYMSTIAEGDVERYVALWTEDMILMPPNNPIVEGKEAARQFLVRIMNAYKKYVIIYILKI